MDVDEQVFDVDVIHSLRLVHRLFDSVNDNFLEIRFQGHKVVRFCKRIWISEYVVLLR